MIGRSTTDRPHSDRAIKSLRPAKPAVDPERPHGTLDEVERTAGGHQRCRTVFLAGAECPFTCVFCDLWRFTTDHPTPRGAIPRQIESALADADSTIECVKLYNASNFFDPRAIPRQDLPAIAARVAGFRRVVVECHPRLVDRRAPEFAARLGGTLELALGLETAHPDVLARLNKGMDLEDFDRACEFARRHELALRAFVLIGVPYIGAAERLHWIERSVRHAIDRGVGHVALIPVRPGNGALDALTASGDFVAPGLAEIEEAFAATLEVGRERAVVTLDTWDLDPGTEPGCCASRRLDRLRAINASGRAAPAVACSKCSGSAA